MKRKKVKQKLNQLQEVQNPRSDLAWQLITLRAELFSQDPLSVKFARYFGYVIGAFGSLIVTPYAFMFGQRVASNMLDLNDEAARLAFGLYFAITGTCGIVAVSSYICGFVFSDTVRALQDSTLKPIKTKNYLLKTVTVGGFILASLAALIATAPGTYLTNEAYEKWIGKGAIPLDLANLIAWTTASTWALYALPQRVYWRIIELFPQLALSETSSHRVKLLSTLNKFIAKMSTLTREQIEQINERLFQRGSRLEELQILIAQYTPRSISPSQTSKLQSMLRTIIGIIGLATGIGSVFFFYPAGKQSGEFFAKLIDLDSLREVFGTVFAICSFSGQASLTAYGAKSCLESIYDAMLSLVKPVKTVKINRRPSININSLKNPGAENQPLLLAEETVSYKCNFTYKDCLLAIVIILLAFSSSAHRIEITAEYVPDNLFGKLIIGLSVAGLFSMNFWGITGLIDKFNTKKNSYRGTFFQKMNVVKTSIEEIDGDCINEMSERLSPT